MYPIITRTSIGDSQDTHAEYQIFGVKMIPQNDMDTCIPLDNKIFFNPKKNFLIKRLLDQNEVETIFYTGYKSFDAWLATPQKDILKTPWLFRYTPVASINIKTGFYPDLYDRILDTFENYFDNGSPISSKIYMLYSINRYIQTLGKIGFKLVRATEKKTIIDSAHIEAAWRKSSTALLMANTMVLMLLLGVTEYIDGEEAKPIITDGKIRKLINRKDVTPERALNGKYLSTYSSK